MKKAFAATIGGIVFQIDEDAYLKLENYFRQIENGYANKSEGKEIADDLERRMAELFDKKTNGRTRSVSMEDVVWALSILGRPEDLGASQSKESNWQPHYQRGIKRLYRDPENKVFGGVCGGLGIYFDIDPVLLRVIFAILLIAGFGFLFYLILWIVVPAAKTITQRMEMYGDYPTA